MEKEQAKETKIKKDEYKNMNKKKVIIVFVILGLIIIYAIYLIIRLIQNPTDIFVVKQGTIVEEETAIGYIIRDEQVIKGNSYKNGMIQIRAEGEKVAKNDPIFRYYSEGEGKLNEKIQELDRKINEVLSKQNVPSGDISALEKQIDEKIEKLQNENNLQDIQDSKKSINNDILKKAKIAGELSPSGSYLKKLIDERKEYENKLNSGSEYLNAPESGVVSYKVDGYEDVLNPKDFTILTEDFLKDLKIKTGEIVATSTESGKIINNFMCYIVSILDSEIAKQAEVGDEVKLRLPSGNEVEGNVEYISNENNKRIIVFKLEKGVEQLVSYRKISFDIIWWKNTGKKIPNTAIGYEEKNGNQVAYITRILAGYNNKIWVKILRNNDKYSIVDNYTSTELEQLGFSDDEISDRRVLTLYDEILAHPE